MTPRFAWLLFWIFLSTPLLAQLDYFQYHKQVLEIESLLAADQYQQALTKYDELFAIYDYVFLKDYKIAAQVAAHLGQEDKAFDYLGLGVSDGWTIKGIKKHSKLKPLKRNPRWSELERSYEALRQDFLERINDSLRNEVNLLSKEDQKLALKYLLKPSKKARNQFIEQEAIPLSERHMTVLTEIIQKIGYPGERLIGNSVWMSTILGHHNSLSPEYQQQDSIYPALKPHLIEAVRNGELDPYDLAVIDDWYITVKSDHNKSSYGIIKEIKQSEITSCNEYREQLAIRSVELRNQLVDIQKKTGIDFYLNMESWVRGKIQPED